MSVFVHDVIRAHLLDGISPLDPPRRFDLDELRRTEWSPEFERLMRNRLVLGGMRYMRVRDRNTGYRTVESAIKRLQIYLADGNLEHLVDAANLALLEFERRECHPNPHFVAVDGNPVVGRVERK